MEGAKRFEGQRARIEDHENQRGARDIKRDDT
jgi:hypothetical protein